MRIRLFLFGLLLAFTLSACGERPGPGSTPDDDDTSDDDDSSDDDDTSDDDDSAPADDDDSSTADDDDSSTADDDDTTHADDDDSAPADDDDSTPADDDDTTPPPVTQCSDGADNDGDTWTDMEDPGCSSAADDDEDNPSVPPTRLLISGSWRDQYGITHVIGGSRSSDQCYDMIDNDGDGLVDGNDSDCVSASDDTEGIPISTGSWELTSTTGGVRTCQITIIDHSAEFVVGQNSGNNGWSRFDWTYRGTDLYVCQVVDDASVALLAISNNTADPSNIASGCNGTDWLALTPAPTPAPTP